MIYKVQVQQKPVEYFIKADSPEEAQELAKEAQASWNFGYAESFESEILESDLDPRNFQPSKHRHREYILEPKTNDVTYRFVVERGLWGQLLLLWPHIDVEYYAKNHEKCLADDDRDFRLTREESDKLGLEWPH